MNCNKGCLHYEACKDWAGDTLKHMICNRYADSDRFVELPCKVGDTVWDRFGMAWEITRVELHMYGRMWFRCGHKGTDDYTAFADEYIGDSFFLTVQEGMSAKAQWDKEKSAILTEAALKGAEHERD